MEARERVSEGTVLHVPVFQFAMVERSMPTSATVDTK